MFDAEQKNIKLIDLGVSTEFVESEAEDAGTAGTYRYMSPEQFEGKLSLKTDIWSFGCVLLQFCTGLKPYHAMTEEIPMTMKIILEKISPLDYIV